MKCRKNTNEKVVCYRGFRDRPTHPLVCYQQTKSNIDNSGRSLSPMIICIKVFVFQRQNLLAGRRKKISGARGWGKLSVLFNPGQGGPEFVHLWFERRSKPQIPSRQDINSPLPPFQYSTSRTKKYPTILILKMAPHLDMPKISRPLFSTHQKKIPPLFMGCTNPPPPGSFPFY